MNIRLNFATGFELPPYFLLDRQMRVERYSADIVPQYAIGSIWQDRIGIKWEEESDYWYFPLDPVLSVKGKNTIIRRNVLKQPTSGNNRRGSIKELWSVNDYEIDIAGVLIDGGNSYDMEDLEYNILRLRNYMEGRKPLMVESKLLTTLNISRLAVEDYSFPFTKGKENQMYNIKAYSDDDFELLIKE